MRPNQEFKNLLNNTNFSLALQQASRVNYDASAASDWSQDYASTLYDQALDPGYGSATYAGTQNGLHYMTATLPGSPPSNLQWAAVNEPEVSDSYTVMIVSSGGSGFDWYHQTMRTTGVFGTGVGLLKVQATGPTFRYAVSSNPSFPNTAFSGGTNQAYTSGGVIYSPPGWYISVYKLVYDGSSTSIYATINGRGSSGGANYVAGSYLYSTAGYPTGAVTNNQLFTVSLSAGQSAYRGESIFWDKALTQYQIDYMENYLKAKWGVTY